MGWFWVLAFDAVYYIQDLQFGSNADHFLVLQGFLMFMLVLDLSDVVLDLSDGRFELSVFFY